jgi:hypothetical protein
MNRIGSHRDPYSGTKKEIRYKQNESYGKKPLKTKGLYTYNKSKRRVTDKKKFLIFSPVVKRDRETGKSGSFKKARNKQHEMYGTKARKTKGLYAYDKNKRRVTNKKRFFIFSPVVKRERNWGDRNSSHLGNKGINIFDTKHRRVVEQKQFILFGASHKMDRTQARERTKQLETKGSYSFNPKKKRVIKKKYLFFFNRHVQEKETSTFSGGKTRKFFSFNLFSKHKKRTIHKKGLFRKRSDNINKRRKTLERDLFNPKMGVKI